MTLKSLGPFPTPENYEKIVKKLQDMIDKNNWLINFDTAVSDAYESGVIEMDNIKNLTEFYNFLNYLVRWVPTEDETGTFVSRMIFTMYFVLGQKTVKPFQSSLVPWNLSPLTELSQWIVDFVKELGSFLDTSQSLTNASLETFYTAQGYNVDAYEKPEGGWKSFNEFFRRKFKNGTRPITGPSNPAVIVNAGDSTFMGCWNIDEKSTITIKGLPWSIEQLLNDSNYKDYFSNGKFMHSILSPCDYHRVHAPVSGKVLQAKIIPGLAYLDVIAQNSSDGKRRIIPIREMVYFPPRYQFSQTRGLIVIDSPIGKVAVLAVGMGKVSSVVLSVNEEDEVKKGDEISYFQFGGSDVVFVFENKSQVAVVAEEGKLYRMGELVAIAHYTP
ncbi:20988_t:CDS:1 [Cetraspora pellucida]|uniref:20988_t:CDS:1 n=1 Tax=Cetraspora pellucida TaxID=1433469 RepID=A0A9N9HVX4_9GLOM|nr:20988_t:CDS:1 [Cetraspora pellucida]